MAKPLVINLPHELGKAEARRRIQEGFGRIEQQLAGGGAASIDKTWDGDRLNIQARAMGQSLTGALIIEETCVRMEIVLPGILGMLAGKVKDRVTREGQILLEKK